MSQNPNRSNERYCIYVDAGQKKGGEKKGTWVVGIYDQQRKKGYAVELEDSDISSIQAEAMGLVYGMLYFESLRKKGKHIGKFQKAILLCDCKAALESEKIMNIAKKLKINISWVPREINLADAYSRKVSAKKAKAWGASSTLFAIIFGRTVSDVGDRLSNIGKEVLSLMRERPEQFPMTTDTYARIIIEAFNRAGSPQRKGDVDKIRKELLRRKFIRIQDKVVLLGERFA